MPRRSNAQYRASCAVESTSRCVAVAVAGPGAGQQVRAVGHRLHAAGHDHVELAVADQLVGHRDRVQPGQAHLVHRHRGHRHRDAALDRGLPGGDLPGPGLDHMTHDHVVDLVAGDPGPVQGGFDGEPAQVHRGEFLQTRRTSLPIGVRAPPTITEPGMTRPPGRCRQCRHGERSRTDAGPRCAGTPGATWPRGPAGSGRQWAPGPGPRRRRPRRRRWPPRPRRSRRSVIGGSSAAPGVVASDSAATASAAAAIMRSVIRLARATATPRPSPGKTSALLACAIW